MCIAQLMHNHIHMRGRGSNCELEKHMHTFTPLVTWRPPCTPLLRAMRLLYPLPCPFAVSLPVVRHAHPSAYAHSCPSALMPTLALVLTPVGAQILLSGSHMPPPAS